jgi:2-oxoglutarate ferredoxin oxidoreductase subunit beta
MANRALTVIAAGGDGDGFAIGTGHSIHALRRNLDLTYIIMDNHIYGLTKGQASPRSAVGMKTKTSPQGVIDPPLSILRLALAAGATFLAQSFSKDLDELTALIEAGIHHPGFALINVFSPCVTYNKVNSYEWFSQHLVSLRGLADYDPGNRELALTTLFRHDDLVTGLIYQDSGRKSYQELLDGYSPAPQSETGLTLSRDDFTGLLAEFCHRDA